MSDFMKSIIGRNMDGDMVDRNNEPVLKRKPAGDKPKAKAAPSPFGAKM
ncbi:MAG: hypothetical protein AAF213_01165 [Pseudomonadota bacterium]